jgi:hypothetical protein
MFLPAFGVHVNTAFGAVVNMGFSFFATDRTFHDLLPPSSFLPNPEGLDPFPLSSLQSVT